MITRFVVRFDMVYRIAGLVEAVGLGLTTLLGYASTAATTNYIASNISVSKDIIGITALVFGLVATSRRWSFLAFTFWMSPLIVYCFANARYVYIAQLSSTVPSMLALLAIFLLLVMKYGFNPLR